MPILTGNEIGERWSIIRAALKLSSAPTADTNEKKLKNVLKALLSGRATCWMTGNGRRPRTLVVTTIGIEEISGTKNLLIYCAHAFEKETPSTIYGDFRGDKSLCSFYGMRQYFVLCLE